MKSQTAKGFTLTEILIVLIVILILAGIAIPKYYSLKDEAKQQTANSFANAIAVASTVNFDACTHDLTHANCKSINSCADFASLLAEHLPKGMYLRQQPTTAFPSKTGELAECQIMYASHPVNFKAIVNRTN